MVIKGKDGTDALNRGQLMRGLPYRIWDECVP